MESLDIILIAARGEDSTHQLKTNYSNIDQLSADMVTSRFKSAAQQKRFRSTQHEHGLIVGGGIRRQGRTPSHAV